MTLMLLSAATAKRVEALLRLRTASAAPAAARGDVTWGKSIAHAAATPLFAAAGVVLPSRVCLQKREIASREYPTPVKIKSGGAVFGGPLLQIVASTRSPASSARAKESALDADVGEGDA